MIKQFRRPCGHCGGTGSIPGGFMRRGGQCPVCKGTGVVELSNVVSGPFVTRLDTDPDRILRGAVGQLESVVVVGHTIEGHEYFASSIADGPNALWILQRTAYNLLRVVDKDADE